MALRKQLRAEQSRPIQGFTSTFILAPTPTSNHVLCEIPEILARDAHRKRRSHAKSNNGCEACKRRRVKCNEAIPCSNCIQRREHCEPRGRHRAPGQQPMARNVPKPRPQSHNTQNPCSPVLRDPLPTSTRLDHNSLYLFHHFQSRTRHTLLLPSVAWDTATCLSFSSPFLLHAILCISARHLAYLLPPLETYYTGLASAHLHRTLSGFRTAISSAGLASKKPEDIDVFIATALLLQFELWANVSHFSNEDAPEEEAPPYNPSADAIFTYSASLKATLLSCFEPRDVQRSTVLRHVVNDGTLSDVVDVSSSAASRIQRFFLLRDERVTPEQLIPPSLARPREDAREDGAGEESAASMRGGVYASVVVALTPLLVYLESLRVGPEPRDCVSRPIPSFAKIARHILCLPILCRGAFAAKIAAGDPKALLILYHFFRAARLLLVGDEFWWAKRRARAVERGLWKRFGIERRYRHESAMMDGKASTLSERWHMNIAYDKTA